MKGYTVKDVARMLDLSVGQIRSYAKSGLIDPDRGERGEYRFHFQDLVLLRTAKGLLTQRIAPQRVHAALSRLKSQLDDGGSLSSVQVSAHGSRIVVHRSGESWQPESGQRLLYFDDEAEVNGEAGDAREAQEPTRGRPDRFDAEGWFRLAGELEVSAPEQSRDAYRRSLELDPSHLDAHINLGRLLHEAGEWEAAERHYRFSLSQRPEDSTALFNLGVVLEDAGRRKEALAVYRQTISVDPDYADAYFNAARLLEQAGERKAALGYLKSFRHLTDPS